jgi:hypothetical protein
MVDLRLPAEPGAEPVTLLARKRKRMIAEEEQSFLLCASSVGLNIVVTLFMLLSSQQAFCDAISDCDLLIKIIHNLLHAASQVNPGRQAWAIPRNRAAVDDVGDWEAQGLTNKVERFYRQELRMTQTSFELLLGELEAHPLMAVRDDAFREPHATRRKLMAWLK